MEVLRTTGPRAVSGAKAILITIGLVIGLRTPLPAHAEMLCQANLEAAPVELEAHTLDGDEISLKTLRGQPVLIDVWATWCSACRTNLIAANDLAATNQAPDLAVIGLSVDHDREDARAWLEEALPGRALRGWQANPSKTFAALDIRALPAAVLLDAGGRVLARHEGSDASELEAFLAHARQCGQKSG